MGIVQRQSFKNSIFNYLGIIIGGLSTMFIYPLDWELYGEIQFSLSAATLFSSFFSLGSHSLINKYFPYFKSVGIKGFLSVVVIYSCINILLVSALLFLFRIPFFNLLEFGGFNIEQINDNLFIILPLAILMVFIAVFRPQSFNYGRIVLPDIISNFSVKLVVPAIVLLSYFSLINYTVAGWILVVYHVIVIVVLLLYIKSLGGFDFKFGAFKRVKRSKHVEMIRYMLYGAMNHVGDVLIYKIDLIMIGLLLSPTKVGYYSIFLFLSVVLDIPMNAVERITGPIVSNAFENKKLDEIQKLYKNASTHLVIIGVILFALIWMNIHTFFMIMTNGEHLLVYKYAFLLLALTKLINMITSINSSIISFSKYFRIRTLFLTILAILNIVLNYLFIGAFDIVGAAVGTGISMLVYNLLKTVYIAVKLKMHPFSRKQIIVLLFTLFAVFLPIIVPVVFDSIFFSALISVSFIFIFVWVIYKLNVSEEINKLIDTYWSKIFK